LHQAKKSCQHCRTRQYGKLSGNIDGHTARERRARPDQVSFEEEAFKRKLTEPELYAQLIRRTLPLDYSKALIGNGFLYLSAPEVLAEKAGEAETSFPLNSLKKAADNAGGLFHSHV
jgi:hypothetical protein